LGWNGLGGEPVICHTLPFLSFPKSYNPNLFPIIVVYDFESSPSNPIGCPHTQPPTFGNFDPMGQKLTNQTIALNVV
jgi:hypothetical protein